MHRNDTPIKLAGFNNLTKALSFNLYDFCVARDERERKAYVNYISNKFSAPKITSILKGICEIIEARVLAVSDQDYEPWGASSLVLMSDLKFKDNDRLCSSTAMHLDKSHICAHTYPDFHENGEICSLRVDIDIATCGGISPLRALNYMFKAFASDVVVIDYVVRGFTRDQTGRRIYMDHFVRSIQDYIDPKIVQDYYCIDLALQSENIWQTKMFRTRINEQEYFLDPVNTADPQIRRILETIKREMRGVLHMWPE